MMGYGYFSALEVGTVGVLTWRRISDLCFLPFLVEITRAFAEETILSFFKNMTW